MQAHFLSCDWGTTAFRLRLAGAGNSAVAAVINARGAAPTFAAWKATRQPEATRWPFYLQVIIEAIRSMEVQVGASLQGLPVVISGMASSTIGIMELPYAGLPFSCTGAGLHVHDVAATTGFDHRLLIISGVRSGDDVMRGEETKLAGCASAGLKDGLFIFPGTHAKHVDVQAGLAVAFNTYMTGELFALLSGNSVLAASVEAGGGWENDKHRAGFEAGVRQSRQGSLLNGCFRVRTNDLFGKFSRQQNYFYLSGMLIGSELARLESKAPVVIAGNALFNACYSTAIGILHPGASLTTTDADEALVRGQYRILQLHNRP